MRRFFIILTLQLSLLTAVVAQPQFSRPHGLYDEAPLVVTIIPEDASSEVHYTTDGSTTPDASTGSTATSGDNINIADDWNVQAGDATISAFTEDDLIDNVMNNVVQYKTSVVLLHEKDVTVESLPRLIESLQQEGVMILPITDDTYVIHHVNVK